MKNITKVRLNNTCINIDRIDLAQRMEKGSVLLRFGETQHLLIGEEAREFWDFYTSAITGTKDITPTKLGENHD